ncbi:hypothetical protein ACFLTE_08980 [Bacteroidota bacterium]
MKKSLTVLIGIILSLFLNAQENAKCKEVGLTFYNLDNFGMTFKIGSTNSLWRINSFLVNGINQKYDQDSSSRSSNVLRFDIKFGREFRKSIKDNFEFRYGVDLSFQYSKVKTEVDDISVRNYEYSNESLTFEPGINVILGFNYLINENLILGAEYLPGINYVFGYNSSKRNDGIEPIESKHDNSGINYGLQSGAALLSLSYRF